MIRSGIVTLYVADLDRAWSFYTKTLGLEPGMHVSGTWAQVSAPGGLTIGLHPRSDASPPGGRGSVSIGFYADRPIDKAVADLTRAGVRFAGPISDDGPVRIASFTDPDDNPLYLCEYTGGAPGAS